MVPEKLSSNFHRSEFACPCGCGRDTVDARLLDVLQALADHYSAQHPARIHITSGFRCEKHNETIPGAAKNSQHVYGRAADFKLFVQDQQILPDEIDHWLGKKCPDISRGIYQNRSHIDSRSGPPKRWDAR